MAIKYRDHMPPAERAKQFMPFAAVKGLEEALEQKEKALLRVPKTELSEDMAALLDRTLHRLTCGMPISVTYYADGQYILLTGLYRRLDTANQRLLVDNAVIPLADILQIDILSDT